MVEKAHYIQRAKVKRKGKETVSYTGEIMCVGHYFDAAYFFYLSGPINPKYLCLFYSIFITESSTTDKKETLAGKLMWVWLLCCITGCWQAQCDHLLFL